MFCVCLGARYHGIKITITIIIITIISIGCEQIRVGFANYTQSKTETVATRASIATIQKKHNIIIFNAIIRWKCGTL